MAPAVIIIGFMGSGKTAVGKKLAGRLGWEFRDADSRIESEMGITIAEAFAARGEAYFRDLEERVVLEMIDAAGEAATGTVISLGGGAVTSSKVRRRLDSEPLVILLDEDVETAFVRASDGTRPLAGDAAGFRRLYEERTYLYRQAAKYSIDTRKKDVEAVTSEMAGIVENEVGRT